MNVRFGPSGNSAIFYEQGHKSTVEAPAWLRGMGLDAYEYSLGRGITVGEETACAIGQAAREAGVAVSVHAPFFINLATDDAERQQKNVGWLFGALRTARHMGAGRVVFHPGSGLKGDRERAMALSIPNLMAIIHQAREEGLLEGIYLCPETMGKKNQLGNLDEVLTFCQLDECLLPCVDFGHLHAAGQGALNSVADVDAILNRMEQVLGGPRCRHMHVHFSTIEYTGAGELRHRTFAEKEYGPRFDIVARAVQAKGWEPFFICECNGTMAEDAAEMKRIWEEVRHGAN
nr:TIM barrel protein [bacterium]